jgi:type VI secretion system protein ImpM
MQKSNAVVGFYGKLPFVGDFVHRRLPRDFIDAWDSWLQHAISISQGQVEMCDWKSRYTTAPIWRFALSPGLCGSKTVAGIFFPSSDKVGRMYPLTIAVLFEQTENLPFLLTKGSYWFELLEDVVLQALENSSDLQSFDQYIQVIPSCPAPELTEAFLENNKIIFHKTVSTPEQLSDAFVEFNARLPAQFMPGCSIWSTAGTNETPAALLVCQGLPINDFSLFLSNQAAIQNHLVAQEPLNYNSSNENDDIKNLVNVSVSWQEIEQSKTETRDLLEILASDKLPASIMRWQSWAITDVGKRRKHKKNEDSLLNKPEACLWVVADGMGGYEDGDVASQLIVNSLQNSLPTEPLDSYVANVENSLQTVNTQLCKMASEKPNNILIGSTVVALICSSSQCAFLWAGDSRLYRLRNNRLQQLTQDHCEDNGCDETSVKSNNYITRAVGAAETLLLDIEITDVNENDIFLLCSDGLDKELSFKEIEQIMQSCEKQDIADTLMREVLNREARDNTSIIVVAADRAL